MAHVDELFTGKSLGGLLFLLDLLGPLAHDVLRLAGAFFRHLNSVLSPAKLLTGGYLGRSHLDLHKRLLLRGVGGVLIEDV